MKGVTGDVFVIPVGDDHVAVGQVVQQGSPSDSPWVAIFWPPAGVEDVAQLFPALIATPPVLFGQTLLQQGRWRRLGNSEVVAPIEWPAFKVATAPGVFQVVDHEGVHRRPAAADEIETLPFRSTMSSAAFEHAIAALAGLEEWHEFFNPIRPGRYTEASVLGLESRPAR